MNESEPQSSIPFNFKGLWRGLIPLGLIGFFTLVPGPYFRTSNLDELVKRHDGEPGLSLQDVKTLSEYSGIDSIKLQSDYNMNGRLDYRQYDRSKLKVAWKKYSQQK